VQSSAIIVQGLANDNVKGSLFNRFLKEMGLSIINGLALGALIILVNMVIGKPLLVSIAIAVSLMMVIFIAAIIGTFVPIILDKRGIDPAIATGPFITTSNDIFGILIFFYISKLILGF
jgi:magnesium transporter